jgi:hypothetical protein
LCPAQLNIANNQLCGLDFILGRGTYTAEGIKTIADALRVSASLTSVSLLANKFDDATVAMLLKLKEEKPSLVTLCGLKPDRTEASFDHRGLTAQDAKLLAPEILVSASLTKISLGGNEIRDAGSVALGNALRDSKVSKLQELELWDNKIGAEGAKAIASYILVSASLTNLS